MFELLKKSVVLILTSEARMTLARYRPKVIAITGSMGKTTAKDAIYAALSDTLHVRKSEKSFNSELGVPLTILGLENAWKNPLRWAENIVRGLWLIIIKTSYPAWLVLEIGADRPGDIRNIARWLRPHIVVITGVPEIPVHVEFFSSPEELAREKRALAEYMAGGTLVLNGDDSRMVDLCSEFRKNTVTYGFGNYNEWYASHLAIMYEKKKPTGIRFKLHHKDLPAIPVSIRGVLGMPRAYAVLAAFAVANIAGIPETSVARSLLQWMPPPGRMRILKGRNGSIIIDDTYNSSPAAALSALDTLKEIKAPRRIAILGDMLELGRYAAEAHKNLGIRAADCADHLLTIGFRSRASAEAALDAGMSDGNIRQYEQSESRRAGEELKNELQEGDVVLVKGSQSMRMERTVELLMAEPERAGELLVRQEEEWKNR
ncbi:MAG: UDP-N-acetylmuramoyl-tripeptide--D-alanyl-D-alanine ligase [Patescibacteria group bacterium]